MPNLGLLELMVILVVALLWAVPIWALIDALRVPSDGDYRTGTKLVWVLVILLGGIVGALIYFAIGKPAGGGILRSI